MNVLVEKHKDGTYWGTVTEVPGVVASYGNTLSELKSNVEQAYADYYELAVDLKEDYVVNLEKKSDFTYLLNLKNIFIFCQRSKYRILLTKRISIPLFCASIRLAKPRPLRNRQKKY